jgi:hypothetical protein
MIARHKRRRVSGRPRFTLNPFGVSSIVKLIVGIAILYALYLAYQNLFKGSWLESLLTGKRRKLPDVEELPDSSTVANRWFFKRTSDDEGYYTNPTKPTEIWRWTGSEANTLTNVSPGAPLEPLDIPSLDALGKRPCTIWTILLPGSFPTFCSQSGASVEGYTSMFGGHKSLIHWEGIEL